MHEEADALGASLSVEPWGRDRLFSTKHGSFGGRPVTLAVSGIGKTAAALATQSLCDRARPEAVLSVGLAGALAPPAALRLGDLVVVTATAHHDFDVRPFFTAERSFVPHLNLVFLHADDGLAGLAHRVCEEEVRAFAGQERPRVARGLGLTGDRVVTDPEVKGEIAAAFPDALSVDMETAAVAQVCHQNGVPWAGVRMISDNALDVDPDQVLEYCTTTGARLLADITAGIAARVDGL